MNSILEIKNLSKSFGKFQALKNITFDIHQGEVFGFIGPNGAGKSTTIRVILGMLKRTSGEVELFSQDPFKDPAQLHKRIAYVPGDVYLWPNLTGGEIIDLMLKMSGQKRTDKTEKLIKRFELDVSKKSRTYSKGNRQKVALIIAFSLDVDFYIFDEPTSGLDPLQEKNFQDSVQELKSENKTVLLSSHILSEVETMVDRLAIIRKGEIIEIGSLDEMRKLSSLKIEAQVDNVGKSSDLLKANRIHDFKINSNQISINAQRDDLDLIMSALTKAGIKDLTVTPPSLDELFMKYYNDESAGDRDEPVH